MTALALTAQDPPARRHTARRATPTATSIAALCVEWHDLERALKAALDSQSRIHREADKTAGAIKAPKELVNVPGVESGAVNGVAFAHQIRHAIKELERPTVRTVADDGDTCTMQMCRKGAFAPTPEQQAKADALKPYLAIAEDYEARRQRARDTLKLDDAEAAAERVSGQQVRLLRKICKLPSNTTADLAAKVALFNLDRSSFSAPDHTGLCLADSIIDDAARLLTGGR